MSVTGLEIAQLDEEFGNHYRQYANQISQKMMVGDVSSKYMYVVSRVIDELGETGADFTEILQAFQANAKVVAKGDLKFVPNKIRTQQQMVAYKFSPMELKKSWAAGIRNNELPPTTTLSQLIMDRMQKKIAQEHELQQIAKGVRVEPTLGTSGTPAGAMDGFLTVLKDKITDSKIVPIQTGTFTKNTIYDYVTEMTENAALGDYESLPMDIFMSVKNAKWFRKDYNVENAGQGVQIIVPNGQTYENPNKQRELGAIEIPYDNFRIVGLPSMAGSNRIIMTPSGNIKKVCDYESMQFMPMQFDGFLCYIFGSFSAGVGYRYDDLVFCNNQE